MANRWSATRPSTSLTGTNNQVILTWNQIPGATAYNVYRSTISGNYTNTLLTTINSGAITSYTDIGTVTGAARRTRRRPADWPRSARAPWSWQATTASPAGPTSATSSATSTTAALSSRPRSAAAASTAASSISKTPTPSAPIRATKSSASTPSNRPTQHRATTIPSTSPLTACPRATCRSVPRPPSCKPR